MITQANRKNSMGRISVLELRASFLDSRNNKPSEGFMQLSMSTEDLALSRYKVPWFEQQSRHLHLANDSLSIHATDDIPCHRENERARLKAITEHQRASDDIDATVAADQ